jgi:D-alanyl-D-alanine carboxypeptidase/D-alanyl-D-alanine carboxypeptidase (penicillin-binding protein 5/6)
MNNDTFRDIVSTYKYSFKIGDESRTVVNHNKLLKLYEGCTGVKTGFTKKSGRCLVSAAERDGVTLIAVTLNDPDDWTDHKKMLDYGFESLESIEISHLVSIPPSLPTVSADGARVCIDFEKNNIVKSKKESIHYSVDLPSYIATDVKIGDKIGKIALRIGEREETIDIIASCDVKIKKITRRFL